MITNFQVLKDNLKFKKVLIINSQKRISLKKYNDIINKHDILFLIDDNILGNRRLNLPTVWVMTVNNTEKQLKIYNNIPVSPLSIIKFNCHKRINKKINKNVIRYVNSNNTKHIMNKKDLADINNIIIFFERIIYDYKLTIIDIDSSVNYDYFLNNKKHQINVDILNEDLEEITDEHINEHKNKQIEINNVQGNIIKNEKEKKKEETIIKKKNKNSIKYDGINVIISTDRNIYKQVPILINSIMKNNYKVNFFILQTGLNFDEKKYITKYFKSSDINIKFFDCNYDIKIEHVGCPVKSPAMFNRIYTINKLAQYIDKGIYLDVDTIVNCSLEELIEKNTGECGLAAVNDIYCTPPNGDGKSGLVKQLNGFYSVRHNFKVPDKKSFNSGVLLMNFKKLVKNNAQEWMIKQLKKYFMTDQPLLNWYSNGRYKSLDMKWNVSANHIEKFIKMGKIKKMPDKNILHWHGKKPWRFNVAFKNIYDNYKNIQIYEDDVMIKKYKKFLENKTIAVVGNAEIKKNYSKEIDNHNVVIRFNFFNRAKKSDKEKRGKKVNVWQCAFKSQGSQINEFKKFSDNIKFIVRLNDNSINPDFKDKLVMWDLRQYAEMKKLFLSPKQISDNKHLSSGIRCLYFLIDYLKIQNKIDVYGFTFGTTANFYNLESKEPTKIYDKFHISDIEKNIVNKYIKEKKINFFPCK